MRRAGEARPSTTACIGEQRELRDDQGSVPGVKKRTVHSTLVVIENPKSRYLACDPTRIFFAVPMGHTDENRKTAADFPDAFPGYLHTCTTDTLDDGAHDFLQAGYAETGEAGEAGPLPVVAGAGDAGAALGALAGAAVSDFVSVAGCGVTASVGADAVSDGAEGRLSLMYQPDPLNTTPAAKYTLRTLPEHSGHSVIGSSENFCTSSNRWVQAVHTYS